MRSFIYTSIIFIFGIGQAAAVTINFDDLPSGLATPFVTEGYSFTGNGFSHVIAADETNNVLRLQSISECTLDWSCEDDGFSGFDIAREDGASFSFFGYDGSFLCANIPDDFGYCDYQVIGTKVSGGNAAGTIGTGDWLNLESVRFAGYSSTEFVGGQVGYRWDVDNIHVQVVPIPATVWLLGSVLTGLGWMRRKQAA